MQTWQIFKNNSSTEVPPNGLVRITGSETDDDGRLVLTADQPNKPTNVLIGVNSPTKVAAGRKGLCTFDALTWIAYDHVDGTPANGEMWGPDNGTWKLKKNSGSLWHVVSADTQNRIALVLRMGLNAFFGQTGGAVTQNSTGTIEIYNGAAGSESDTNDTENGRNAFGDIADNKKTLTLRVNGTNYIVAAECD